MFINAEIILEFNILNDSIIIDKSLETHMIYCLHSIDHLVASIDSIIKNALVFSFECYMQLNNIIINCNNNDAVDYIIQHCTRLFRYQRPYITFSVDYKEYFD